MCCERFALWCVIKKQKKTFGPLGNLESSGKVTTVYKRTENVPQRWSKEMYFFCTCVCDYMSYANCPFFESMVRWIIGSPSVTS
jgi:hypothetical protein